MIFFHNPVKSVRGIYDVDLQFDNYLSKFVSLYNKHFPKYQYHIKENHMNKPYITTAIRNSIKQINSKNSIADGQSPLK